MWHFSEFEETFLGGICNVLQVNKKYRGGANLVIKCKLSELSSMAV
jgi:hypothetical protein